MQINVKQAALKAECAPSTMRRWLASGKIEGVSQSSDGWLVEESSLMKYLASTQPKTGSQRTARLPKISEIELLKEQVTDLKRDLERERARNQAFEEDLRSERSEIRKLLAEKAAWNKGSPGLISWLLKKVES